MTAASSEAPSPAFTRDANGLLRREDFTPENLAALMKRVQEAGGYTFLTEEQREASRRALLAAHPAGADLWVFGYGSLMWNPAIRVVESRAAHVTGYRRNFCLTLPLGRATPERPGLMLAIQPGGALTGAVHRIVAADVESETSILWMREMMSGAYVPTWLDAETNGGTVRAFTFVINPAHPRCEADLTPDQQAARIALAQGQTGTNRDYLYRCHAELERMGVTDPYIEALFLAVTQLTGEEGIPS